VRIHTCPSANFEAYTEAPQRTPPGSVAAGLLAGQQLKRAPRRTAPAVTVWELNRVCTLSGFLVHRSAAWCAFVCYACHSTSTGVGVIKAMGAYYVLTKLMNTQLESTYQKV
jgi:hypothetical protein